MRLMGRVVDAIAARPKPGRRLAAALSALLLGLAMAGDASAHEARSTGQKVYLSVYSSIAVLSKQLIDLAVTLSFRNLDGNAEITVTSVTYFDTGGKKVRDLLGGSRTLAPFGSTEVLIRRQDFRGDTGANVIVEWSAASPVTPPLIKAIMVGTQGTQAFAFTSRGIVLD